VHPDVSVSFLVPLRISVSVDDDDKVFAYILIILPSSLFGRDFSSSMAMASQCLIHLEIWYSGLSYLERMEGKIMEMEYSAEDQTICLDGS